MIAFRTLYNYNIALDVVSRDADEIQLNILLLLDGKK